MATPEKINFNQRLDFTETFNIGIKFIRQNFFPLMKCLLFIAGPFVLMAAMASAYYQKSVFSVDYLKSGNLSEIGVQLVILLATTILSSLTIVGTVYEYIIFYMAYGKDGFDVNDIGKALFKDIGNIFWTFFGTFLLMLIAGFVIAIIFFVFSKIAIPVLVIFMILFFIGLFIIMFPMMFVLTSIYLIRLKDEYTLMESISHALYVMKGNFWWTWIIMFCVYLSMMLVQMIFVIPQSIMSMMMMVSTLSGEAAGETSIAFLIVSAAGTFFSQLAYFIFLVFAAVHYFSLYEKKEGKGLMDRIDEIGTKKDDSVEGTY